MFRYASERALRAVVLARLIGNYPAAAFAVVLILQGFEVVTLPEWSLWAGCGLFAGLWLAGHLAEREQGARDADDELLDVLGHWPRAHEREDADAILACAAVDADEPVQVDDEGEAVR